ncbi:hypothetical protein F5Y08DRAFT_351173 [Xylaria arbuscula]|nr:hypothetical protein F5Y08DRAFT_351173 [Xylaria arbuscula]
MPGSTTSGNTTRSGESSSILNPHYRNHYLKPNNINFLSVMDRVPEAQQTLVRNMLKSTNKSFALSNPNISHLENNVAESDVETFFNTGCTEHKILLDDYLILATHKRLPMLSEAVPNVSEKRLITPTPNLLSGYHNSAFEDDIQLLALERVANGKDLLYPFLAIHFVGEKGNMWNATNQCLGALATSTNLVEQLNIRLLQSGRPQCNLINSTTWGLAMNGAEARLFVCWKQGEMFQIRTVQCIHFRGSSLHTLWHFVENILKWGTDERLEEIRGGLKELANPQSAGDE